MKVLSNIFEYGLRRLLKDMADEDAIKASKNYPHGEVKVTKPVDEPWIPVEKKLTLGPNDKEFDLTLGHADPYEWFTKPKAERGTSNATKYLQPKENVTRTTGISEARANKLRSGEIVPNELPEHTADMEWVLGSDKPYDLTQFVRDSKGADNDFYAKIAKEYSKQYGNMFDAMPYDTKYVKPRFEHVGDPRYITPHTGKFVQKIRDANGKYAKYQLSSAKGSGKQLQEQVNTAIDIANNTIRYATPEDRLDAFINAMKKIEANNIRYVNRGKPTKVKEDVMNYLWQIHDDIQMDAMIYKDKLLPQRTVTGDRMFNDVPTIDRGKNANNIEMDEYIQDLYRGDTNYYD